MASYSTIIFHDSLLFAHSFVSMSVLVDLKILFFRYTNYLEPYLGHCVVPLTIQLLQALHLHELPDEHGQDGGQARHQEQQEGDLQ